MGDSPPLIVPAPLPWISGARRAPSPAPALDADRDAILAEWLEVRGAQSGRMALCGSRPSMSVNPYALGELDRRRASAGLRAHVGIGRERDDPRPTNRGDSASARSNVPSPGRSSTDARRRFGARRAPRSRCARAPARSRRPRRRAAEQLVGHVGRHLVERRLADAVQHVVRVLHRPRRRDVRDQPAARVEQQRCASTAAT